MGFEMVDGDERPAMKRCQGAARHGTHHQGPDQTWGDSGSHRIQIADRESRVIERLVDQVGEGFHMPA